MKKIIKISAGVIVLLIALVGFLSGMLVMAVGIEYAPKWIIDITLGIGIAVISIMVFGFGSDIVYKALHHND